MNMYKMLLKDAKLNDYFTEKVFCKFMENTFTTDIADVFMFTNEIVDNYRTNYHRQIQLGKIIENNKPAVSYTHLTLPTKLEV